ncbi:MAG: tetratricopeptide repeat protein, partial [Candidatus Competibacteraceae bacterium]|nr:tetratricopeptide repeat protein [Candidatus Competibacteraceae bacterium]
MDQYTDDERVEDLKKWWKENGASIIGGIALGLVAIFGWQYWNSYRATQAEAASQAYDIFVAATEKPDAEQARQQGQGLLTDFPHSAYAALTALRLAKLAMDSGDTAAASQRLEWVIGNAQLDEFKDIARLRLARVLFAAGRTEEAGKLLESVTTTTLMAERDELRGDLYLASNDAAKARTAYAAALAASGGNTLLQLKFDNLAPPTAESIAIAPAEPPPAAAPVKPAAPVEAATPPVEPATPVEAATPPVEPAAPVEAMTPPVESAAPVEAVTPPVEP